MQDVGLFFQQWKHRYEITVRSILGEDTPRVTSTGTGFYNKDRWTARLVLQEMCDWAQTNSTAPTTGDVVAWVKKAHSHKTARQINIASMDYGKTDDLILALMGGAYHEAFHSCYTARRQLLVKEVADVILPRWHLVPNWSAVKDALLMWDNIVEDIRIERRGTKEYPGCWAKMDALQDFILTQERGETIQHKSSTLVALFRDLGLGYQTSLQLEKLQEYEQAHPDVFDVVTTGDLAGLVEEAIALDDDDLGSMRIAMDVVGWMHQNMQDEMQKKRDQGEGDAEEGQGAGEEASGPKDGLRSLVEVLASLLAGQAPGLLDSASAIALALQGGSAGPEDAQDLQGGEPKDQKEGVKPWCPWTTDCDDVTVVKSGDHAEATALMNEVAQATSMLQSRLRVLLKADEVPSVFHGVRRGRNLSDKMMIRTVADMRAGREPRRAYYEKSTVVDTSMAVAVCVDQSGSMYTNKSGATRTMMAVAKAVEGAGGCVQVVGFMGRCSKHVPYRDIQFDEKFHRYSGVTLNVFKRFEEKTPQVIGRFVNFETGGTTPMSDGLQYCVETIKRRPEHHKLIITVTDGYPDDADVVRWEEQECKRLGIKLVGVAVGCGSEESMELFDCGLWVSDFSLLGPLLIKKIETLVRVGRA